jgi:hypothetical protein
VPPPRRWDHAFSDAQAVRRDHPARVAGQPLQIPMITEALKVIRNG